MAFLLSPKSGSDYGRVVTLAVNTGTPSEMASFSLLIGSSDKTLVQVPDKITGANIASGLPVTLLVSAPNSATFTAKTYWVDNGDHEIAFTDFTATYEAGLGGWLVSFIMPEVFGTVDDNSSSLNFHY